MGAAIGWRLLVVGLGLETKDAVEGYLGDCLRGSKELANRGENEGNVGDFFLGSSRCLVVVLLLEIGSFFLVVVVE